MKKTLTWLASAAALLWTLNAQAAGTVNFAQGGPIATNSQGESRVLRKDARILPGEVIQTARGDELVIVMDDNAVIALRQNSTLRIDDYTTRGEGESRAILTLAAGFMRSVSGWIGKRDGTRYQLRAGHATIGIRGTDHETGIVTLGANAGVYHKVNEGGTSLTSGGASITVKSGQAALAKPDKRPPVILDKIPDVFQPSPHDDRVDAIKNQLSVSASAETASKSVPPRCDENSPAVAALREFVALYEAGNIAALRAKLDSGMVGLQALVDSMTQDQNRQKQIRMLIKDVQIQCGPDLTVINYTWEKRFLDVNTFTPGLMSGRAAALMHRAGSGWNIAAFTGDNAFASSQGTAASITFQPGVNFRLDNVSVAPLALAAVVEVVDADQAKAGNQRVQILTSQGDMEMIDLPEISPGRFRRDFLTVASGSPTVGDGVLQLANGVTLTMRYLDRNPGGQAPARMLTRSFQVGGTLPAPAVDTTPDAFSFVAVTQAPLSSVVTSGAIIITGINAPSPISITGGSYSINGGAFTTAPGTVSSGQSIQVRVISAAANGTGVSATLNIGGVGATFSVTTLTILPDTTPDPFAFAPVNNATLVTTFVSNSVVITGINAPAPVSITGGSYSINGGTFTTAPGTISNGQSIAVQVVSAGTVATPTTATVIIGGVSGSYTVTTVPSLIDTTPDPFSFTPQTNAALSILATSNTVTITGINSPTPVSVSGGQYSISGGPFTSAAGTINNGQTVVLRLTSSGTLGATVAATLNVGGVSGTFSVTTTPPDTTPNPFSFTPQSLAAPSTTFTSNTINISGINTAAPISVTGGSYSISGGAFTTAAGTISNGQPLALQGTSSAVTDGTGVQNVTVNVGGVIGTYTITTRDTTPNGFSFPATTVSNGVCAIGGQSLSATVTITGIDSAAPVTISSPGFYSIAGGAFVTSGGTITNGQTLTLRRVNPAPSTSTSVTVTIGQNGGNPGTSATWTITCV
ncbi:MAG: FecR domain-containing protein [Betaproteobacteria bacterium]|nr:FecR domain-containing protein [Betaproteobacteria bacterium]